MRYKYYKNIVGERLTLTPSFVICASLRCFVNHRLMSTNCSTAIIRPYRPWLTYMLHWRQFRSVPTAQLAGTMLNVCVQKERLEKWRGGIGSIRHALDSLSMARTIQSAEETVSDETEGLDKGQGVDVSASSRKCESILS